MTLQAWREISDPTTRQIALVGDSTTERGWGRMLRSLASNLWGDGGLGFRHMGKQTEPFPNSIQEWTQAGTWTKGINTDPWNISPTTGGVVSNNGSWHAKSAAATFTWKKGSDCKTITSFDLFVADGASAANFAYSIDGGAFVDVSQSWAHTNALKKIHIASSVFSTVTVRAANAVGTAVDLYMIGIEPHYSTTGVRIHEIAAGGEFSNQAIRTADAGNWHAWFDMMQPQLVFCMFINDAAFWGGSNPTNFQQRLDDFGAMVTGYGGTVVYYTYVKTADGDTSVFDDKTARELAVAQKYGGHYYNLNEIIGGTHAAALAANFFDPVYDEVHPNFRGMRMMANHAWNIVGAQPVGKKSVRV
jgi:hypothetical protein